MNVRPSQIAGIWYPDNPQELEKTIKDYLSGVSIGNSDVIPIALISPHAGYKYSGSTAGHAFKAIEGKSYDLIVILSPFHDYHPDSLLISGFDAYSTPLGNIPIDNYYVNKLNTFLEQSLGETMSTIINEKEHSLEILLPFLQVALSDKFKLLPIMFSGYNLQAAEQVGKFLADIAQEKDLLIVASTDLSHFHSLEEANTMDAKLLEHFKTFNVPNIISCISSGKGEACGIMPIISTLTASLLLGAEKLSVLNYSTSAEITNNKSSVVGYASAIIT